MFFFHLFKTLLKRVFVSGARCLHRFKIKFRFGFKIKKVKYRDTQCEISKKKVEFFSFFINFIIII